MMSTLFAIATMLLTPVAAPAGALKPNAMRTPTILPAPPTRAALDLGPILVTSQAGQGPTLDVLLLQADKLGADGFVLENKSLGEVYGLDVSRQAKWRKDHPGWSTAADVGRFLLTGMIGPPLNEATSTQKAYYRAFRYLRGPMAAADLVKVGVPDELRSWFDNATDLQAQLLVAHALFAQLILDAPGYERLRGQLLAFAGGVP
jgi:hypothetical protein